MSISKKIMAGAAGVALVGLFLSCNSTPAASSGADKAPAPAAVTEVKAPASGTAYIFDSFETVDADGKIQMAANKDKRWVNLSNEGWGGWKGSKFTVASSTEYATEGSKSMLLSWNDKMHNDIKRKGGNGACVGLGWHNDGPFDVAFKGYKNIAYVAFDYHFELDPASDGSDKSNIYIQFFLAGRDGALSNDGAMQILSTGVLNTDKPTGTFIGKFDKEFGRTIERVPQFALKVFSQADETKSIPAADVGKIFAGKLWIDNIRLLDATGTVLTK